MSRETNFIREVILQTEQSLIRWSVVNPSKYAEVITQSPFAYQAFGAKYSKGENEYSLLLVHKKAPSFNAEFEVGEERFSTEMIVLREGLIITVITEYDVDENELHSLSSLVHQENDDVKALFE